MGNAITYKAQPNIESIKMSNGLTSVFIDVLSLASSALSKSDRQRELAAWFASRDQSIFGSGVVGFDISELPWQTATFNADQDFILRSIDATAEKTGWERLDYEPREDWVSSCLNKFRLMVQAFVFEDARNLESAAWLGGYPSSVTLCPIHQVYKYELGCVLCNGK